MASIVLQRFPEIAPAPPGVSCRLMRDSALYVGGTIYGIEDVCTHDGGPLDQGTLFLMVSASSVRATVHLLRAHRRLPYVPAVDAADDVPSKRSRRRRPRRRLSVCGKASSSADSHRSGACHAPGSRIRHQRRHRHARTRARGRNDSRLAIARTRLRFCATIAAFLTSCGNEARSLLAQGYAEGADGSSKVDLLRRFVLGELAEVFGQAALKTR